MYTYPGYSLYIYAVLLACDPLMPASVHSMAVNAFNPLNAKLNPICHLLALLGAHNILHVNRIRVKCNQVNFKI